MELINRTELKGPYNDLRQSILVNQVHNEKAIMEELFIKNTPVVNLTHTHDYFQVMKFDMTNNIYFMCVTFEYSILAMPDKLGIQLSQVILFNTQKEYEEARISRGLPPLSTSEHEFINALRARLN